MVEISLGAGCVSTAGLYSTTTGWIDANPFAMSSETTSLGYLTKRYLSGAQFQPTGVVPSPFGGGSAYRFAVGGTRTDNTVPTAVTLESTIDINLTGNYAAYNYPPADIPAQVPKFRTRVPIPQQLSGFFSAEPGTEFRLYQDALSKEFEATNVPRDQLPALHAATTVYRDIPANYTYIYIYIHSNRQKDAEDT